MATETLKVTKCLGACSFNSLATNRKQAKLHLECYRMRSSLQPRVPPNINHQTVDFQKVPKCLVRQMIHTGFGNQMPRFESYIFRY